MDRNILVMGIILAGMAALATHSAFGDPNFALLQQEERRSEIIITKIQGNLECIWASTNSGEACNLKIRDTKSGKKFGLLAAAEARKLFYAGTKNVVLRGTITANGAAIQVIDVKAL